MHELLKSYVMEGLCYIDKSELVKTLKQTDNLYYIDDLNYLTMPSVIDCLCGYLPGTLPSKNFCYTRLLNKKWCSNLEDVQLWIPNECVISCRDIKVLELYLDFFFVNRIFKRFSLNVPVWFDDVDQSAVKILPNLIEKYNGYYNLSSQVFDYRLLDLNNIFLNEEDSSYVIESCLQDQSSDEVPIYDDWYVLKKYGNPIFVYGCSLYYHPERIGKKCFSFGNDFHTYEDKVIETEDVLYLWKYLAKKFANDGYVIKGIAIDDGFDNDEMYQHMGMEKYRSFIKLKTDN